MIPLLSHHLLNSGGIHPSKYSFLKGARNCCAASLFKLPNEDLSAPCYVTTKCEKHEHRRLVCTQNDCIEKHRDA